MAFTTAAQAGVKISAQTRDELLSARVEVKAGIAKPIPIQLRRGDTIEVHIDVAGGTDKKAVFGKTADTGMKISSYICDENSASTFKGGRNATCPGLYKASTPAEMKFTAPHSGEFSLMLDNSHGFLVSQKAIINIVKHSRLSEKEMQGYKRLFGSYYRFVRETFRAPDFDLTVAPCGSNNAFTEVATGNITICSELIFDSLKKDMRDNIAATFYHELGHSLLLNLGLPNGGNEETVDEFAIVMMFWNGQQQQALDWIKSFEGKDATREFIAQYAFGDTHPLSINRIRKARQILRNPEDTVRRWNELLYPYLTDDALRAIINDPPLYGDRKLAQAYLTN